MHMFACIYCFFPLFSPVDPETNDAPVIDYAAGDTSSFAPELLVMQNPLVLSDIAHFFPSLACIRTAIALYESYSDP